MREARQLGQYGVAVSEPVLDYHRLLARVREVVADVRAHIDVHQWIDALGVTVHEQAGTARASPTRTPSSPRPGYGFRPTRSSSAPAA
jgi:hypothetical protein